jgi:hypothetical protein
MNEEPEKQPPKSEPIVSDPTLFDTFWLNEIKSLDDTGRILLSVTILLVSAYFTIVGTNFEKIKEFFNVENYKEFFILLILLLPPVHCWFVSLNYLWRLHIEPPLDAEPLLDTCLAKKYLIKICGYKRIVVHSVFLLIIAPFIYFIGILVPIMWWKLKMSPAFTKEYIIYFIILIIIMVITALSTVRTITQLKSALLNDSMPPSDEEAKKKGWWEFWK